MKLILASASPRRQELLKEAGFTFEVRLKNIEESYPEELKGEEVAEYLASLKAKAFEQEINADELIITADTVVRLEDKVLGKPKDREDAINILKLLSGKKHIVTTGVCLHSIAATESFSVHTEVYFKELSTEEIEYYVDNYKPYDKAGAYGIQEWIGYVGIEKINGSFYNVMGLPIQKLYERIREI